MTDASARVQFGVQSSGQLSGRLDARTHRSKFNVCISLFALAEAASVILTAFAAKLLYLDIFVSPVQATLPYLALAPLLATALFLFLKQADLYEPNALTQHVVPYGRIFGALTTSFLILLGILYVLKLADWYSRGWFLTWFSLCGIALIAVRIAGTAYVRRLVARGKLRQRIAVFGTPEFVTAIKERVESSNRSAAVEGLYSATPVSARHENFHPDGGLVDLRNAIERKRYDTIIVGFPMEQIASIKAAVNELASYSTELLLCTGLDTPPIIVKGSREIGMLRADVVNLVPLSESNRLLKSVSDYLLAAIGLFLLSPLFILVAIAIKLDSRGPVFFRQRRYGQNNRIFRIFKFRTMFVTEDGNQVKQAERNDPRVTRIGWYLRRMSLDELPQLINVLTGDMSIVGPRPHALVHDQQFEQQLDLFLLRRRVRPGLTGWAQVHGFRGETKTTEEIRSRVEHDLYYIDNWSIWLDIEIMFRTIFVLFRGAF